MRPFALMSATRASESLAFEQGQDVGVGMGLHFGSAALVANRPCASAHSALSARSIAAGSGQRMAARSKVGQAAILDRSTILWPPRRSALRIGSGRLSAAAIAAMIISAAKKNLIAAPSHQWRTGQTLSGWEEAGVRRGPILRDRALGLGDGKAPVAHQDREPAFELIFRFVIPLAGQGSTRFRPDVLDRVRAADLERHEMVQRVLDSVLAGDVVAFENPICAGAVPVAELSRSRAADRRRIGRADRSRRERRVGIGEASCAQAGVAPRKREQWARTRVTGCPRRPDRN